LVSVPKISSDIAVDVVTQDGIDLGHGAVMGIVPKPANLDSSPVLHFVPETALAVSKMVPGVQMLNGCKTPVRPLQPKQSGLVNVQAGLVEWIRPPSPSSQPSVPTEYVLETRQQFLSLLGPQPWDYAKIDNLIVQETTNVIICFSKDKVGVYNEQARMTARSLLNLHNIQMHGVSQPDTLYIGGLLDFDHTLAQDEKRTVMEHVSPLLKIMSDVSNALASDTIEHTMTRSAAIRNKQVQGSASTDLNASHSHRHIPWSDFQQGSSTGKFDSAQNHVANNATPMRDPTARQLSFAPSGSEVRSQRQSSAYGQTPTHFMRGGPSYAHSPNVYYSNEHAENYGSRGSPYHAQ
jgi:hypothetical protein